MSTVEALFWLSLSELLFTNFVYVEFCIFQSGFQVGIKNLLKTTKTMLELRLISTVLTVLGGIEIMNLNSLKFA